MITNIDTVTLSTAIALTIAGLMVFRAVAISWIALR